MIHGDFFHPEPGAQPERGRKPRPLIRVTAHLDEADIRQLEGKEARRDRSRVAETLGDLVGLRLPEQHGGDRRGVDHFNGHRDRRG